MYNNTTTLNNHLVRVYNNYTPLYLPKGNANMSPQRSTYKCTCSNITPKSHRLETVQKPTNKTMFT